MTSETIDLSPHLSGGSAFQIQFRFVDDNMGHYGWAIDNVAITSRSSDR